MGCGISTMDGKDAPTGRRHWNGGFRHQHANVAPPIVDNNIKYHDIVNNDDGDDQESTKKEEGFDEERLKEKKIVVDRKDQEEKNVNSNERQGKLLEEHNVGIDTKNNVKNHEYEEINNNNNNNNNNYDNDDRFIGVGSPSFREYCNDRDSIGEFNDCTESGDSSKTSSDDDSTKPGNEKNHHSNKEPEKKERRGRGFRNVRHRGKGRGRKKFLNFGCYNSSTQSYAEGSLNKLITKPNESK